jgi:hypothetical protein
LELIVVDVGEPKREKNEMKRKEKKNSRKADVCWMYWELIENVREKKEKKEKKRKETLERKRKKTCQLDGPGSCGSPLYAVLQLFLPSFPTPSSLSILNAAKGIY